MSTRNLASVDGPIGSSTYIAGDYDPSEFKYTDDLSRDTLLSLLLRNPKIQKSTVWYASEMLRERWEFKEKQPISAPKHSKELYDFETFDEWLEWNGFLQELLKALFWSLLFGDSILVFYTGKEKAAKKMELSPGKDFVKCKAYYPITKGSGYILEKVNSLFNVADMYKIKLHAHKASESVTIFAPKERVVRFSAPALELKYAGTSVVSAVAHDCIGQEQIKRGIVSVANNLQPGILVVKAATKDERDLIDNSIGDTLTHLRRVYVKDAEELEKVLKLVIPDLKIDQIEKLNRILQTDIATGTFMSISILEGAPQGALSSAAFDTFNTYSRVKQLQSHYKQAVEKAFFKLGKKNTVFTWNDPTPKGTPKQEDTKKVEGSDKKDSEKEQKNEEVEE